MRRLAYSRLAAVIIAAAIAATLSQWQGVFGQPLPDDAGIEEILSRAEIATVRSANAIVSAVVGAVMGFFVRADKSAHWSVLQGEQK